MAVILIVGASSGIGLETARLLVSEGHSVIGTRNTKEDIADEGNLAFHSCNVLDEKPDFSFMPETLDGVVFCPGTITLKPFHRISPETFLEDYNLQVVGAVKTIQAALAALKKGTDPSIVLFSTTAVETGLPFHTLVSSSKGALEGLTRALAAELAPTVRVNCIAPSLTDTPLAAQLLNTEEKRNANAMRHPLKRIGKPEDLAHMAAFLLSEKAAWITGQVFHVDGGISRLKIG